MEPIRRRIVETRVKPSAEEILDRIGIAIACIIWIAIIAWLVHTLHLCNDRKHGDETETRVYED